VDLAKRAYSRWQQVLKQLAAEYQLIVVLMPGHSLLRDAALETDAQVAVDMVLSPLEQAGLLQVVDLRSDLMEANLQECEYYSDLVHSNRKGMRVLSESLMNQLRW
jgi:lysophospholipase L1-like esterase